MKAAQPRTAAHVLKRGHSTAAQNIATRTALERRAVLLSLVLAMCYYWTVKRLRYSALQCATVNRLTLVLHMRNSHTFVPSLVRRIRLRNLVPLVVAIFARQVLANRRPIRFGFVCRNERRTALDVRAARIEQKYYE